jgi:hypothetical protein
VAGPPGELSVRGAKSLHDDLDVGWSGECAGGDVSSVTRYRRRYIRFHFVARLELFLE